MVAKYTDHSPALDADPTLSQDVACQVAPCHYPYTYHLCQATSQLCSHRYFSRCAQHPNYALQAIFSSKAAQKIYSSSSNCATYCLLHVASSSLWLFQILVAQNFYTVV